VYLQVEAVELIMRKLNDTTVVKHESKQIDIDVQRPSGCWTLIEDNYNLCYKHVTNIVVRLGDVSNRTDKAAVLINCHFDSVPDAPGANDDTISCAIMLDMLRIMAGQAMPLKNDVIFLFNGAEEDFLLSSHGFITQHPWRHSIRAFLNLEGVGAGGRQMMFQVPPHTLCLILTISHFYSIADEQALAAGRVHFNGDTAILHGHGTGSI
jgi:acetylornithine deacetylase/succinyl-diaminopimelate desuccinylase-like protein